MRPKRTRFVGQELSKGLSGAVGDMESRAQKARGRGRWQGCGGIRERTPCWGWFIVVIIGKGDLGDCGDLGDYDLGDTFLGCFMVVIVGKDRVSGLVRFFGSFISLATSRLGVWFPGFDSGAPPPVLQFGD